MIKTIISDLGNVILNFDHRSVCDAIAAHSRYTSDEIYRIGFNSDEFKLYDAGKIRSEELFEWILEMFDLDISYDTFQSIWSGMFSLNDPVRAALTNLKRNGYRLILLSNTNELHFDYIRENFKVIEVFDDLILSYKLGYSKPHQEIFEEALRRANSPPKDCVYIDDIEEFCKAAEKLGISSIVYRSTEQLIADLKELGVKTG